MPHVPIAHGSFRSFDGVATSLERMEASTGADLSVYEKNEAVQVWGYLGASQAGVWEAVQIGDGTEVSLTTNGITRIVSTDITDTMDIHVHGHYLSAVGFVEWEEIVTLTGTTPVVLPQPLARCDRMHVETTDVPAGNVTVTDTSGTLVYNRIVGPDTQSEKCALTTSYRDCLTLMSFGSSILGNNNAAARFRLEVKDFNGVWRPIARWQIRGDNTSYVRAIPYAPYDFTFNTDLRIMVNCSLSNTEVEAHLDGIMSINRDFTDDTPGYVIPPPI